MNSIVANELLKVLAPTLDYNAGSVAKIPVIISKSNKSQIDNLYAECLQIAKLDWDSFETSWDFKRHPLLSVITRNSVLFDDTDDIDLAEFYTCWENECNERFNQLKANEEELNRIFIDIYGLQDELTPK